MVVLKLNDKENLMTKKGKRKASNKDIVKVIGGLINEIEAIKEELHIINGTFDLYIAFRKNGDKFKEFIDNAIKVDNNTDELQKVGQDNTEPIPTREAGQKEYARNQNNAFANFERVGDYVCIDKKQVLMVYLLKHIDGIMAYINGHKSQREGVEGRITDAIVYLLLLRGMVDEDIVSK